MNSTRYVNPNVAMELIAKVPPIPSKERVVWCDGGDEHLGHPKVYINLVSLLFPHKKYFLCPTTCFLKMPILCTLSY